MQSGDHDPDATLAEIAEHEPNTYRECAEKFLRVLHSAVERMPNSVEKWGVAFATANPICMGLSMHEVATRLGVSRAALSYQARKFCDDNGLPPSTYMKSETACRVAQEARRLVVHIRSENQKNK